ncbi:MAG: HAMP domain-containing protein [Marinicaulis sp.]|nr:sensor N-terminal transmembrane domain-containing protein [Marinicaulis sp.]NNE41251.1 HAMP domain-containing protein [Marinicaulis sp.]NNL89832.1 HAMP domain-containing protein [Marinicaulis sp.]
MTDSGGMVRKRRSRVAISRLTLTIVLANIIGLVILLLGSFALTQYRDGLIQAKFEGVRAQSQIIADILAQVAIDETSCQPVEEEDILEQGEATSLCSLALRQNDVREVFNRIWDSFEGRVRIFNAPQTFDDPPVKNALDLLIEDVVLREDEIIAETLAPINPSGELEPVRDSLWTQTLEIFSRSYRQQAARRTIEAELNEALNSSPFAENPGAASVRINEEGELVASVSVPIRRVQAIYGVVTTEIGGIDALVDEARLAILPFFGLAFIAAILSSLMLTATIAQPIRQLAIGADKVREGIMAAGRARIPDFTHRKDEIGELSGSLKSMTQAIYARIDAIESFAADVAHELKNPLTSIRSAAETLTLAKTPEQQQKLMAVIQKDVARMDRLITDISNASRMDAELARETREAVDLTSLIRDISSLYGETAKDGEPSVEFNPPAQAVYVLGNPSALGQVIRNLVDNARSFSPPDKSIRINLTGPTQSANFARIIVDDDGPGIPPDNLDAVFNRFYTKRPHGAAFGNNSGLGLSISRQIVNSHNGRIFAENRHADPLDKTSARIGARFVVELPAN